MEYEKYVKYKSAYCRLRISEKHGEIKVTSVYASVPGKGDGTELMRMVCEFADEFKMDLHLIARASRTGPLNNQQLQEFYKKFGFKYIGNGRMRREFQNVERTAPQEA